MLESEYYTVKKPGVSFSVAGRINTSTNQAERNTTTNPERTSQRNTTVADQEMVCVSPPWLTVSSRYCSSRPRCVTALTRVPCGTARPCGTSLRTWNALIHTAVLCSVITLECLNISHVCTFIMILKSIFTSSLLTRVCEMSGHVQYFLEIFIH